MEIKVTKNKILLDDKSKLNENEYNINNIDFTFSEEYTQELVKIALFSANNTNYKEIITQNQCKIPSEILANEGVFVLGVYAYSTEDVYKLTEDTEIDEDKTYYTRTGSGTEEEPYEYTEVENPIAENLSTYYEKNVKLSLRYSPSPIKLVVDSGSYIPDEQTQNSEPITASELEQYQQALNDGLREAENVNISAEKVDKVATITIIDRYGDETSVEIQDGTDGKDAKINGVNTLTIKAGQNIEIEQEENTLIINGQSNYNNLTNKPKINNVELTGNKTTSDLGIVIPDVSGFITKDVNNLTNYTLKTNTGSLIDLEINQSTYVVTLKLKDIDGNVISTDTIDLPLESVVVGGSYDATNKKIVLTLENGNTVDIPVGDLIAGLQTEITSQNKLASDLVDDSNSGNKFVNTSEKNSWNAKYDKPNGGIPKTDLASAVQTSLDKADTAVQDVSDKEDISNKVTEIDETSTDTEYPSAKLLYDELAEKQEQIDGLVTENALLKDQIPNGTAEGTNVQITDSSNLPIEDGVIKGDTSQESTTGKNVFKLTDVASATKNGVTYSVENQTYNLSGTNQKTDEVWTLPTQKTNLPTFEVEQSYTFKITGTLPNDIYVQLNYKDSSNVNHSLWSQISDTIGHTITIPNDYVETTMFFVGIKATATNVTGSFKIQIEKGSSATEWEPYTNGASPNPDYKQDIHTVTGDCEVEVVNKNLFVATTAIDGTGITTVNCIATVENDVMKFTATGLDWYFGNVISEGSSWNKSRGFLVEVEEGATYTVTLSNLNIIKNFITNYDENKISMGFVQKTSSSFSYTIPTGVKYITLRIGMGNTITVVGTTYETTIQIEKSSTASDYTSHAHQTFPIGLTGKNLFDVNSITSGYELDGNTGNLKENSTYYTSDYIGVKPNTSYFISSSIKTVGSSNWFYDENKTPLVKVTQIKGEVIVPNNAQIKYIRFNGALAQLQNLMFILGHEDAPYVPYRPPIELCNQDCLFKNTRTLRSGRANPLFNPDLDEEAWYKYSAIGKVVLDGTEEGWAKNSLTFYLSGDYPRTSKTLCSHFINQSNGQWKSSDAIYRGKFSMANIANQIKFMPIDENIDTLVKWKTWLSANNVTLYYALETPTYIKITDTALIAQLEAYYNSSTYRNVTNIITAGEDLPPIASIVYKKDLTTLFNKLDSLEARVDLLE